MGALLERPPAGRRDRRHSPACCGSPSMLWPALTAPTKRPAPCFAASPPARTLRALSSPSPRSTPRSPRRSPATSLRKAAIARSPASPPSPPRRSLPRGASPGPPPPFTRQSGRWKAMQPSAAAAPSSEASFLPALSVARSPPQGRLTTAPSRRYATKLALVAVMCWARSRRPLAREFIRRPRAGNGHSLSATRVPPRYLHSTGGV